MIPGRGIKLQKTDLRFVGGQEMPPKSAAEYGKNDPSRSRENRKPAPAKRAAKSHHPLVYASKEDRMKAFQHRKLIRNSDEVRRVSAAHPVFTVLQAAKILGISYDGGRAAVDRWKANDLIESAGVENKTALWRAKA